MTNQIQKKYHLDPETQIYTYHDPEANKFQPKDLIPQFLSIGLKIETEEDLIYLGKNNLEELKKYWRKEERNATAEAKDLQRWQNSVNDAPTYEAIQEKKESVLSWKHRCGIYASYLASLTKRAEEKPYLLRFRPHDVYNAGDEVMCFIDTAFDFAFPELKNTYVSGRVVKGYRYHNGHVCVRCDIRVHNDDTADSGHGLAGGVNRPEIMKKWEYEYFMSHSNYFEYWLKAARAELIGVNIKGMYAAIQTPVALIGTNQ